MSSQSNDSPDPLGSGQRNDPGQGNRPADGARQSTPGEVFSDTFHGSDAAGDFLGLDVDMASMYQAGSEDDALELAEPLALDAGPSDGWTDDAAGQQGSDLDPANVLAGDPQLEETANGSEWAEEDALAVEELDDADFEDDVFQAAVGSGSSNRWALIALPFAVGAIAVAGVVLLPRVMEHDLQLGGIEIASNSASKPSKNTGLSKPDEKAPHEAAVANSTESGDGAPELQINPEGAHQEGPLTATLDGTESIQGEIDLPGGEVAFGEVSGPEASVPGLDELIGELVGEAQGSSNSSFPASEERLPVRSGENASTRPSRSTTSATGRVANSGERATLLGSEPWSSSAQEGDWSVIWQGEAVPMDAISSAQRVLTPRVGGVRVLFHSGEIFDGKLYAVGEERIWLDALPGRMGLEGRRIASIERLDISSIEASATTSTAMGDRVKVRVPGGHLFGNVLAREADGTVTVAIESGGRVTLADADIVPLGKSRVRVIR